MAKISRAMSFRNAQLDLKDKTITEFYKDCTKTYDLTTILEQWDGIEGISLNIKLDDELPKFKEAENGGGDGSD